ncbi:MAG: hypothetical protein M3355_11040 [Actinomycetota bacterium]|nr:hypothetical protein [Actinomycetota bacterium]
MTWTRRLRVAKFRLERAHFAERIVSHRYGGHSLQIIVGSPYGERYDRDWAELPEIALLKEHRLRPGALVFNLGANHGVVALMSSSRGTHRTGGGPGSPSA